MTVSAGLKDLFTRNLRQSGIFVAFVAIVGLFTILTDGVLPREQATQENLMELMTKERDQVR